MNVFGWLNDQLLRMQWLSDLVTAGVQAVGLDVHGLPVEKLTAGVSSADGREVVATAECRLNETNTLSAKGTLTLTGDQEFAASWNADCRDHEERGHFIALRIFSCRGNCTNQQE